MTTYPAGCIRSNLLPPQALAPAYLARIIAGNDVARMSVHALTRRRTAPAPLDSQEYAASGHCAVRRAQGGGQLRQRLPADVGLFRRSGNGRQVGTVPIFSPACSDTANLPTARLGLVGGAGQSQIDVDTFTADPALAFVQTDDFPSYWHAYSGRLWSLEERLEAQPRNIANRWIGRRLGAPSPRC